MWSGSLPRSDLDGKMRHGVWAGEGMFSVFSILENLFPALSWQG